MACNNPLQNIFKIMSKEEESAEISKPEEEGDEKEAVEEQNGDDEEEKPAPKPKKVKKNLRVGKTAAERSYTNKETLLQIASRAYQANVQKNELSLERDAERNRKKVLAEQRRVEKRQARLDRKKEKEEKIKQEALNKQMKKKAKKNQ